jgi:DNA-binding NarL/FixJ family response regulator
MAPNLPFDSFTILPQETPGSRRTPVCAVNRFDVKRGDRKLKTADAYPVIAYIKNCCRCGGEFRTLSGRVCSKCRKPEPRASQETITRDLSFREKQIAQLVSEAKPNKEIAFELHLTEGTIKEYLNRMFRKLGVKNRTELALWMVRNAAAA